MNFEKEENITVNRLTSSQKREMTNLKLGFVSGNGNTTTTPHIYERLSKAYIDENNFESVTLSSSSDSECSQVADLPIPGRGLLATISKSLKTRFSKLFDEKGNAEHLSDDFAFKYEEEKPIILAAIYLKKMQSAKKTEEEGKAVRKRDRFKH